jgi:hypothetical protein
MSNSGAKRLTKLEKGQKISVKSPIQPLIKSIWQEQLFHADRHDTAKSLLEMFCKLV